MAEIKRYSEIMEDAAANMIARQDKVTDFNEGSIIYTILDTVARLAEQIYISIRAGFNYGLKLLVYSLFKFEKKSGNYASGKVIFSRAKEKDVRSVIPTGTKVSQNSKTYETTQTGYIEAGKLESPEITIKAVEAGKAYNAKANTINTIESNVSSDIVAVDNPEAITGGTDEESDEELENRFTTYINGLDGTSLLAIQAAALSIDSVRSVSVKNHKPPLYNVFNLSVYVDDGAGNASSETLAAVKSVIEGSQTQNGHLAPGINARYLAPNVIPVNIELNVTTETVEAEKVESEISELIQKYVNSLLIGKSVILSAIIAKVRSLSYVKDVVITSPASNIVINSEQIARFEKATINLTMEES